MNPEKIAFILGQSAQLLSPEDPVNETGTNKAYEGKRKIIERYTDPETNEGAKHAHTVPLDVYEQAAKAARLLNVELPAYDPYKPTFSTESALAAGMALQNWGERFLDEPDLSVDEKEVLVRVVAANSVFAELAQPLRVAKG